MNSGKPVCSGVQMAQGCEEGSDTQGTQYFTGRRMEINTAEETGAEKVKLEGGLGMVGQNSLVGTPLGEGNQINESRKGRGTMCV